MELDRRKWQGGNIYLILTNQFATPICPYLLETRFLKNCIVLWTLFNVFSMHANTLYKKKMYLKWCIAVSLLHLNVSIKSSLHSNISVKIDNTNGCTLGLVCRVSIYRTFYSSSSCGPTYLVLLRPVWVVWVLWMISKWSGRKVVRIRLSSWKAWSTKIGLTFGLTLILSTASLRDVSLPFNR